MSNKQNLQEAVKAFTKAKKETAKKVSKAVESIRQSRQEQAELSSHQD